MLHPGDRLAVIPKSSILSIRTCALAPQILFYPYGWHGATLALSLALYSEQFLDIESRWHGYLQSRASYDHGPITPLWGHRSLFNYPDAVDAARWLHGTEVQRELQDEGCAPRLTDEIDDFYHSEVYPLLGSVNLVQPRSSQSCTASDRASTTYAPPVDRRRSAHTIARVGRSTERKTYCRHGHGVLCATGGEVFNTYGATLGTAALLAQYGFVLNGAETDTVTFGWPGSSLELERDGRDWMHAYRTVRDSLDSIASSSSLVYIPETETERSPVLSTNSDGRVCGPSSCSLGRSWMLCRMIRRACRLIWCPVFSLP
ncbi:hypothetical protein LXA43DRAFT_950878 [Ganoderma leucocontextum]|nr:hypothetical protein LXA43DRAFT_950878 [Ganoderma leucocontextum]